MEKIDLAPSHFINMKGEKLSLLDIALKTKVTSVTIEYATSKNKRIRYEGWKGWIGLKKEVPIIEEMVINDNNGITFSLNTHIGTTTICFSNKKEYEKITNSRNSTLYKCGNNSTLRPYKLNFKSSDLKGIDWEKN